MIDGAQYEMWAGKYCPTTLSDMILPASKRSFFERYLEGGCRQSLVFYGKPGTGKTKTANLLVTGEKIDISCGRNDDLERIRRMLSSATSVTLYGNRRTIIIDDCERLSPSAQHALREIEQLGSINDFIFTTNGIDFMDPALRSRLTEISFDFVLDESLKEQLRTKMKNICGLELVEAPKLEVLNLLIKKHYPDIRKMIGELQKTVNMR